MLGEPQAHQEQSVSLDGMIRENQYPFVEAALQGLPKMLGGGAVKGWAFFHLSGRELGPSAIKQKDDYEGCTSGGCMEHTPNRRYFEILYHG